MRRFLILTGREIRDHLPYFAAAAVTSGLLIALLAEVVLNTRGGESDTAAVAAAGLVPIVIALGVGLCALGSSQMHTDRTGRVSAFLATLPVTRSQIFLARLTAGVLAILILLVPLMAAGVVVMNLRIPPVPLFPGLLRDLSVGVFLVCLVCYSIGLHSGWNARVLVPTLGVLPLVALAPLLIVIKGFGLELVVILAFFALAGLTAAWCRFSGSPL
jgi:ABC-type transport system involved in multi-copper enzyme maturation permease subunit